MQQTNTTGAIHGWLCRPKREQKLLLTSIRMRILAEGGPKSNPWLLPDSLLVLSPPRYPVDVSTTATE